MTFPLWLQIAVGIITAEIVILGMKGIKNRINQRDTYTTGYTIPYPDRFQEEMRCASKGMLKTSFVAMGLMFILLWLMSRIQNL